MHPVIKRTIVALSVTYALAWAGAAMVVGPGSATLVDLTGRPAHAGFFVALFSLSSAMGAFVFGRLMDRFGRKPVLIIAHLVSMSGYTLAGMGAVFQLVPLFVVGGALLAGGFGGVLLTRVAAAEIFPATERGRGVGWVQVSATVGAVVGPLLLVLSDPVGHFTAWEPLAFVWFFAPPLHLVAAVLLLRITEPLTLAREVGTYHPQSLDLPTQTPVHAPAMLLPLAILALAANQAAMAAVMGIAGAAVHQAGYAVWVLGAMMFLHFVGMFGLSRVVGKVADRFGRRNTILVGMLIIAFGGAVIALLPGIIAFAVGLMLVGFGWSFGFIGATVLLTDITAAHKRARIVGRADLTAQLSAAALALAGGWWFARQGIEGLGVLAAFVVLVPALLLLVFMREASPGVFPADRQEN